jgi:hypothetical protein
MATWIVLSGAIAFNVATLNPYIWGAFTGVTMLVYGQMWELEKYRVSVGPFELVHSETNDDDD